MHLQTRMYSRTTYRPPLIEETLTPISSRLWFAKAANKIKDFASLSLKPPSRMQLTASIQETCHTSPQLKSWLLTKDHLSIIISWQNLAEIKLKPQLKKAQTYTKMNKNIRQ